jgi:hypothetical protein
MKSTMPCYPLIELLRYVDRHGIPSKVTIPGTNYESEDAVLVPVPSRVLTLLRALADGEYVVTAHSVVRRVVQVEETVIADDFADAREAEEARASLARMKAGRPKKGGKR